MDDLSKAVLRKIFLDKRDDLDKSKKILADQNIFDSFFKNARLQENSVIAGYFPIKSEVNVTPILKELINRGHTVLLPHVKDKETPLTFYEWREDTPMVKGEFGILEPAIVDTNKIAMPDIVITPLVAFDKQGYRLGYGSGLYDRTIAQIKDNRAVFTVGIGYELQLCDNLPIEETDMRMDMIITDKNIYTVDIER